MSLNNNSEAIKGYELNVELLIDILSTMRETFDAGTSEFSLISRLKQPPYYFFDDDALRDPLMLFKTHFVLFHALYRLKAHWQQTGTGNLDIHTLNIQLHEISHASHGAGELQGKDKLAEYYLNWDNFQQTNRNEVESLLDDFWQSMAKGSACVFSPQDIEEAHTLLQLPSVENGDMPLSTLKKHYKKALLQAHPDKGGSQSEAQSIIRAFQILRQHYT
ncbi:DNA-J related domain-containing protein [Alteromonas sp. McT4-15]|uniref:DNA-J related domain-containing protein n=1 Tax=Alteromonas sp. McT4-15 TaxID=2881256 RepID=UPI001CF839E8|nr:DNA-J related domain-containing protein [Alteromonas sp. McT4-15]